MRQNIKGFTLAELMIITAIIGLIVAIAIPNFANARKAAAANACKANLRQLQGAVIAYSIEKGTNPDSLNDLKPDYMRLVPHCPLQSASGNSYAYNSDSGDVACTVDAANHNMGTDAANSLSQVSQSKNGSE